MPVSIPEEPLPTNVIVPSPNYFPLSNSFLLAAREKSASLSLPQSGVTARYWIYSGKNSAAGTIFLTHGFRGDHHGLLPIVEQLPGYRIVAVDLPGFGQTEPFPARKHDVAAYSDFLKEFIDIFQASSCLEDRASYALAGHSFGSLIASHFAARRPPHLGRLILINPIATSALAGQQKIMTFASLLYYQLAAKLPQKLGLALLRSSIITCIMSVLMTKSRDPSLRRFVREQHRLYFSRFASREVVLQAFESSISETVSNVADKIGVPTLLLAGENDEIVSTASQRELQRSLSVASLEILSKVGHLIHYEKAYEAALLIDRFLSGGNAEELSGNE